MSKFGRPCNRASFRIWDLLPREKDAKCTKIQDMDSLLGACLVCTSVCTLVCYRGGGGWVVKLVSECRSPSLPFISCVKLVSSYEIVAVTEIASDTE